MAHQQQRYKVLEKIASGGMAEVFRAESAGLEGFKKTVAIKRVLPHLSEKKQFIGMFLDEARVSAHLSHSNCVQVFDIGVGDNTYFIVMEYVDGSDLKGVIEYRKRVGSGIPVEEACLICVRLCEGLSYAHELRDGKGQHLEIVHRDLSPPNVLLTRHGEVKIVDFGLAKANSQLEHSEPGIIKGKFSYLSPEAAQGLPVDARTDIFCVGIILWELLANRRLFVGDTDLETVQLVQNAAAPPLRQFNPRVPPYLESVVAKSLARDPAARYQTARELGQDLNGVLFKLGRAVSSFDIARLVEPVRAEREAKARQRGFDKGSIIGSLIEEVLFEFRSLQAGAESTADQRSIGSKPLSLETFRDAHVNVNDWATELGEAPLSTLGTDSAMTEPFNLAALEEEESVRRSQVVPEPASDGSGGPESPRSVPHPEQKSGSAGVTWLFVVLLLLAAAAGSYYSGLWP